jgi:hypothetical protein
MQLPLCPKCGKTTRQGAYLPVLCAPKKERNSHGQVEYDNVVCESCYKKSEAVTPQKRQNRRQRELAEYLARCQASKSTRSTRGDVYHYH